jgi:hypothetical protein
LSIESVSTLVRPVVLDRMATPPPPRRDFSTGAVEISFGAFRSLVTTSIATPARGAGGVLTVRIAIAIAPCNTSEATRDTLRTSLL